MKKKITLIVLAILLLAVLVGPLLVPVPPLSGLRPAKELADADSQFIRLNNLDVHIKTRGQGEPVFVLMHGFGASLYSWNKVMDRLGEVGTVIAFDRPAFGLTERPMSWQGENPYSPDAQMNLVVAILDHYGVKRAILVGNSAGGTLAMEIALKYPERVSALVLVDPAVYNGGGAPAWIRPLFNTPQIRHLGPLFARQLQSSGEEFLRSAWHDPNLLSAEQQALYKKPLLVENWDRALWEMTLASRSSNLVARLDQFKLPILVITGDDDRIVPTEESVRLGGELPGAHLVIIPAAGHVPHEEQPDAFMEAVLAFVPDVK
jgi:pimeloyl-ACP methyl ester carboxylesterase